MPKRTILKLATTVITITSAIGLNGLVAQVVGATAVPRAAMITTFRERS